MRLESVSFVSDVCGGTADGIGVELPPFVKLVSYLVDPASSHMLVSKIKPCMSKFTLVYRETANGSLNQLWFNRFFYSYMDNCGNSRANTCTRAPRSCWTEERIC